MHGARDAGAAVAPPVVLIRYRSGVAGETARTVHVVSPATDGQAGAVGAVCGAVLLLKDIETVIPGEGMPCTVCVVHHVASTTPAGSHSRAALTMPTPWGWQSTGPATSSGADR